MAIGEGNSAPPQPDCAGRTAPTGDGPTRSGEGDAQLLRRFAADHDEEAFAALVRRHGPLVLGVCQRVLNDRHEAEDAFQATFLVLVRRARALHRRGSLAGWLHTVARRLAVRASRAAARRPAALPPEPAAPGVDPLAQASDR